MRPHTAIIALLAATVAALAGWFAGRSFHPANASHAPAGGERKILFYQSAMHPWIKSDQPGKCTICGMELTPVFEGDAAITAVPGFVTLGSNAISVLNVKTIPARKAPLVRTLRVAGVLNDNDSRRRVISAWVPGRIDQLHVGFVGAEVTEGQPLARFFSPSLLEAERQFLAIHRSHTSTPPNPDHSLLLETAAQRLLQLGLTQPQIQALPSKPASNIFSDILAPASGTVISRFAYPGQYVAEGEKLFEIADLSTLWFLFDAYEQDLPFLAPDQPVEVTSPTAPGQSFTGSIRFIDPNLSDLTRSAKVRVELTNPVVVESPQIRRALPHRAFAEGRLRLTTPEVLLVPRSAVLSPGDQPVVYVDHGSGAYEQRPVRLGRLGDDHHEVLEGLAPDEPVVVQGNLLIDAQAQLNQTLHSTPDHPNHPEPASPSTTATPNTLRSPIPQDQASALRRFLESTDTLRAALAQDNLPAYQAAAAALPETFNPLRHSLASHPDTLPVANALPPSPPTPTPTSLRTARANFHAFAAPLVPLVRKLRTSDPAFADLKVYRCPMTAESFDGAPPRAEWFQIASPIRNPWFGAEMLECGVEIRD